MTDASAISTTPADTATPETPAAPAAPFYSSFQDSELKGYIESKGFKETQDLALSYKNLEKLVGVPADQLLKLPKDDDKSSWDKVYDRLGRPGNPEDYGINGPEGDDGTYAKYISSVMHELGITKKQAQTLAAKQNEFINQQTSLQKEQYQNTIKEQEGALRTKWGQAYDKNVQIAKGSFAELGISTETVDALEKAIGYSGVMEFFHNIGSKIGEHKFVSAEGTEGLGGAMSPDAAKAEIDTIKRDPELSRKYANGDSTIRARMDKLQRYAANMR